MPTLEPHHPPRSVRWGPWKIQPAPDAPPRRLRLLLLHGFAGAPGEMRPLGQALASRGFHALAPLLPGHGENLDAMREVLLEDWTEAVVLSYESLRHDDSPVAIVGFSLGGALALRLAGRLNPRAICCLSTPARPLANDVFPVVAEGRSTLRSLNDSPSAEVRRWRNLGCHEFVPEPFMAQYQILLGQLEPSLVEVRCSIVIAQSRTDSITPPSHAEVIADTVSSARRKLVWSRGAGHALPLDVGRRALFSELAGFLEEEDQTTAPTFRPS